MTAPIRLEYVPSGPVLARFYEDRSRVSLIMGPFGSGKTRGAYAKIITRGALMQPPSPIDNVRRFKCIVMRDNYRTLQATAIATWVNVIPRYYGDFKDGGTNAPTFHHVPFLLEDGTTLDLQMEFRALGDQSIESALRGFEASAAFLNEIDTLPPELLMNVDGRVGRYPSVEHGGCTDPFVVSDMNAPDDENWTYKRFVDDLPENWAFFRQPSGLSPQAENVKNLPPDYYRNISIGKPDWWVRRFVRNEFGYSRDGKPVYGEYSDKTHVAQVPLEAVPELPILIGMDAGQTPAAVFAQRLPNGQWRILEELVSERGAGVGPKRFSRLVSQTLIERFPAHAAHGAIVVIKEADDEPLRRDGWRNRSDSPIRAWCDPAAVFGEDRLNGSHSTGDRAWRTMVENRIGIRIEPAPSNNLTPRLSAVRDLFTESIDGDTPRFVLSPRCKTLRKGFNSGYRYRREHIAGTERYTDEPEKNDYSHVHDALQYLILGGGEYDSVMGRKEARGRVPRTAVAEME